MGLTRFSINVDGMTIEGEGVVTVQGVPDADPTAAILEFLDYLDPAALEQEALQRMGWGDSCQTAKVIEILREQLTGTTG